MVQTIFFIDYSWREEKASRGCVILYTFRRKLVDNLLCICEISNCILPSKILNILGMMMMYTKATIITMVMMMQVGPGDDYVLTVGGFNDAFSTLGDSMITSRSHHNLNGMKFSTK